MKATGTWILFFVVLLFVVPVSAEPSPPVAAFASNITTGQVPMPVRFIDASINAPSAWIWAFGDGGTSTLQNPEHTYLTQGVYTVSLTVSNAAGSNTNSMSNYITVNKAIPPVASLTANKTFGTVPLTVNFTDASANSPSAWVWTFGDGGWDTTQNPSHTYTVPGIYTVSLTATNNGGSNTYSAPGFITANKALPPEIAFTSNITMGSVPLTVSFTDMSTNSPTAWSWSFGDGSTSVLQNPVYTYTTAGTFQVMLTASNYGGSKSLSRSGYVTISPQAPPVVAFTSDVTSGPAPLSVNFTDTSSNSPHAWSWSFGDGGTSSLKNPVHLYTTPGKYAVSLLVTNYGGNQSVTMSNYTTVHPSPPVASFTSDLTSGPVPLTVSFSDTSSGDPAEWTWTFGDGTTTSRQNPSHTYAKEGTYAVSLVAINDGGSNTVTRTGYITAVAATRPGPTATAYPTSTPAMTATTIPVPATTTAGPVSSGPDLSSWALPAIVIIGIILTGAGILYLFRRKSEHHGRQRRRDL